MKNIFSLPFSVLCFTLLFAVALAQETNVEPTTEQLQQMMERYVQSRLNPRQQLRWEADHLTYRSTWHGYGSWMSLNTFLRMGGEAELGLTEEQKARLSCLYKSRDVSGDWQRSMDNNPTPEYTRALEAIQAAELPDDPTSVVRRQRFFKN
jgi:hypothetical protein